MKTLELQLAEAIRFIKSIADMDYRGNKPNIINEAQKTLTSLQDTEEGKAKEWQSEAILKREA